MRKRLLALLLFGAVLLSAPSAWGAATWTVEAYTSSGVPLYAVSPGRDQLILDITLRTSDRALGIAGSVNDYDNSIVGLNTRASLIPTSALDAICIPGAGCFGGLYNHVGSGFPLQERAIGPGVEAEFFVGVASAPAGGDGSLDPGIATGIAGDPQFRIVFDVIGIGSTTLQIGTFAEYLDDYTGSQDSIVHNTSVTIITGAIPEPGTALLLGIGLAGLAGLAPPGARQRKTRRIALSDLRVPEAPGDGGPPVRLVPSSNGTRGAGAAAGRVPSRSSSSARPIHETIEPRCRCEPRTGEPT